MYATSLLSDDSHILPCNDTANYHSFFAAAVNSLTPLFLAKSSLSDLTTDMRMH